MFPTAQSWFERNTWNWRDWTLGRLLGARGSTTVSVVLPALDEEPTIGRIVTQLVALRDQTGLIDEIVVIDSGSADRTAEVAAAAGAVIHHRHEILPAYSYRSGKGEVLWKSLAVTSGDLIVYIDADLIDFRQHYVLGLLGPLLTDESTLLVKAFYDRPLLDESPAGGGRVTELMARPLLNAFLPELAGLIQPLAGEYAARRTLLESLPFSGGYGVEIGILIDTYRRHGLDAIAQVDLGHREHGHQDTAALGRMASVIARSVLRRVVDGLPVDWPSITQFTRAADGAMTSTDHDIGWPDLPPMIDVLAAARKTAPDGALPG